MQYNHLGLRAIVAMSAPILRNARPPLDTTFIRPMIPRLTIVCLGASQLVLWGISYYLIGVFGEPIAKEFGWDRAVVYGGFSAALVVMAVVSPFVGMAIDRYGGRRVMIGGALLCAGGCMGLATMHSLTAYYAAWLCLGVAMRASLYDAAFATLARIGGPEARLPMAQITLLGGLASTCFWPIGRTLVDVLGWRGALFAYAGFALVTVALHMTIPEGRYGPDDGQADGRDAASTPYEPPHGARELFIPAALYALIVTITNALNSGLSAHIIRILGELGLAAAAAGTAAMLWGVGQSSVRLANILFGRQLHPLSLNLMATLVLPLCMLVGMAAGYFHFAGFVFVFFYGVGNGIMTITRGTLPLMLFDPATYGAFVGRLLVPSFIFSAASPIIYAAFMDRFGGTGALWLSIALSSITLAASIALKLRHNRASAS